MSLIHRDLQYTVSKKISIDEFEPKTDKIENVIVTAFFVSDEEAAQDLHNFLSSGAIDIIDSEVSPNPDPDNNFLVFVELPREKDVLNKIRSVVKDVENVTGRLHWEASTHLTDDYYPIGSTELSRYIINDPKKYMNRSEWEAQNQKSSEIAEAAQMAAWLGEFLKDSLARTLQINENKITITGTKDTAEIKVVACGEADEVFKALNIHNNAIKPLNSDFRKLNYILGEMQAVPIDKYIIIFHPADSKVIVGEACFS